MHVFQVAHNCHLLFQVVINCKSEKKIVFFFLDFFAFCILPTTHYYSYNKKKLFRTHTHTPPPPPPPHKNFLTVLCTSFGIFFTSYSIFYLPSYLPIPFRPAGCIYLRFVSFFFFVEKVATTKWQGNLELKTIL